MLQAFVFNEIAIIVRHWFEIGPDDNEHGTRIEIRRLVSHGHRGSESAAQPIELDEIIWRADLFDSMSEEPGNFARAHHHLHFDGVEPRGRDWDDRLSADPFGWLEEQLDALPELLSGRGAVLEDHEGEAADVRRHLPAIMSAARRCAATECTSPHQCAGQTRDTTEIVAMQASLFRRDSPGGPHDPRGEKGAVSGRDRASAPRRP
ncbi:MAG: hypothetical protein ACTHQQ_11755 [Solirubrobacteraceae bacterium]